MPRPACMGVESRHFPTTTRNLGDARAVREQGGGMVRRTVGLAVGAVSLAMVGAQLTAQQSAPAAKAPAAAKQAPQTAAAMPLPRAAVTIVQIKPELVNEWQDFQKNETIPTLRKAGVTERTALTTVFGESFEYIFLTPVKSL